MLVIIKFTIMVIILLNYLNLFIHHFILVIIELNLILIFYFINL